MAFGFSKRSRTPSATSPGGTLTRLPGRDPGARRPVNPAVALIVIAGAQLMVVLDVTIVNVALPHIQSGLGFSRTSLAWVVNAYTLAFGGLLLLGGRAGDILGRRRVFMAGVSLFAVASMIGGLAANEVWLIAARALQGVGAALAAPNGLALLTTTFQEGRERARAFGVFAAVAGAGGGIGLILGGVLTSFLSWRWVFFVNVPIGAVLVAAASRVLPEAERTSGRFDLPGAITVTAGVSSLVYGFIHAAGAGWNDPVTIGAFAAAAILLPLFVAIERRGTQPLMPLHLFEERTRWGSYVVMLMTGAAMFGVLFFLTQYMQNVLDYSPLRTGLAYLPLNITFIAVAQVASRAVRRTGPQRLVVTGTALTAIGLVWLSRAGLDTNYLTGILPGMELLATGFSLIFLPVTMTALAGVERRVSGVASATLNVSQQVGGALGVSALVTLATSVTAGRLAANAAAGTASGVASLNDALVHGWTAGFRLAVAFAAVAFVTAMTALRPAPGTSATAAAGSDELEPARSDGLDELPVAG